MDWGHWFTCRTSDVVYPERGGLTLKHYHAYAKTHSHNTKYITVEWSLEIQTLNEDYRPWNQISNIWHCESTVTEYFVFFMQRHEPVPHECLRKKELSEQWASQVFTVAYSLRRMQQRRNMKPAADQRGPVVRMQVVCWDWGERGRCCCY
jgi:hypothetical protein